MSDRRGATPRTALRRGGVFGLPRGGGDLARLGPSGAPLLPLLGRTADPDLALSTLVALVDRLDDAVTEDTGAELLEALEDDEGTAMRLLSVLGASSALGDHLLRHPGHWR